MILWSRVRCRSGNRCVFIRGDVVLFAWGFYFCIRSNSFCGGEVRLFRCVWLGCFFFIYVFWVASAREMKVLIRD